MSQDNREKAAARTTIVGGRPPGSGKEAGTVPRGIEILLKKAAVDESFRKILLSDRLNAADAIGLTLNPVEVSMLKAIPEPALEQMVVATKVQPKIRQAFMGYTAAVMLAALTAASDGISQNAAQLLQGIQPDPEGIGQLITAGLGGIQSPEDKQAAQYKAESYMKIAPRDENAPRGSLEVAIEGWQDSSDSGVFMKVHLTKLESPLSLDNTHTEGLGYARRGRCLQENIPVGEYLVEIDLVNQSHVSGKIIKIAEKQTATAKFNLSQMTTTVAPTRFNEGGVVADDTVLYPIMIAGAVVGLKDLIATLHQEVDSYMRIAPRDENALRGSLKVTIDNWQNAPGAPEFLKIHFTKIESSTPSDNSRTEGVKFARKAQPFLQENIPVGEYLVEIGFADESFVRSKKITITEKNTATVNFKITVTGSGVDIE
jgi:hypothetical protein